MVNSQVKFVCALVGLVIPAVFGVPPDPSTAVAVTEAPAAAAADSGTFVAKIPGAKSLSSVDCASSYALKCADCRNFAVCAGETTPMSIQSCASINPAAPYCVNGACSSSTGPDGGVCGAEFRCSGPGYFPHPTDCSKYFFCDKVNGDAFEYSCGENRVYLSRQKSCANRTIETGCETINCNDRANSFVQYTSHLAYYAFCSEANGRKETIMYKCSNDETDEFSIDSLKCNYQCPGEGRFYNPGDCASFYECYQSGLSYQAIKWSCPMGFKYNTDMQRCEQGACP